MNRQQTEYALQRVNKLEEQKIDAAKAKFTKEARRLGDAEKLTLINSGKVKVRKDMTSLPYHSADAFDFSKFCWPLTTDATKFDPARDAIQAAATKVRDQIVLGDTLVALALIEEFAKV